MGTYKLLVLTNAVEGRDDEFNQWYDHQHIPDALDVPGYVAAQRFRLADVQDARCSRQSVALPGDLRDRNQRP